jgi:hypothetical protein
MITLTAQADTAAHAKAVRDHEGDVAADRPVRFHKPTAAQTAVRNELEELGRLDTKDAISMVLGRFAEIDQLIEAGKTPEQIAVLFVLRDLVGVEPEQMKSVMVHLETEPDFRTAVRDFSFLDLEAMFGD